MANRFLAAILMLGVSGALQARPPAAKSSSGFAQSSFGSLSGKVTDARGTPQMGALVMILGANGQVLHRVYTNQVGAFVQDKLAPGVYQLKVTLTSFLPAIKEHVTVEGGSKAFLSINLSSLTDTLAGLVGTGRPRPPSDNDWKWVVRSAGALRPVLRLLPAASAPPASAASDGPHYSDYRGHVEFGGGGGGASSGFGGDATMSTGFSMAQTLFADTTLLLGGNVGYDHATPASAFRGILHRDHGDGESSEMSVTVRQIQLPGAYFARGLSRSDNFLSTSSDLEEHTRAADWLRLVYGVSYDSVLFLGQINTVNPHGKIIAQVSPTATLQASYSQGPERQRREGNDPLRDVASQLTAFPQVSLRNGRAAVERDQHAEIAYRQKIASQSLVEAVSYVDHIGNFSIGVAGQDGFSGITGDLLPDVFSNMASINGGTRTITGGRLSWEQGLGEHVRATASYSVAGLPVPATRSLSSENVNEIRDTLRNEMRQSAAVKLGWDVPGAKTRFVASYKWINGPAILPRDLYSDSLGQIDSNFNILIRQPIPQFAPFMGKVEALADFRNLLSQGYIPMTTADGKTIVLVQNVRTFRGGLSFNF